MKDFAKKYLDSYNGLSKIVKILLCLLWDIPSTLYRFSKSALKDNTLGIILAILIGIVGGWILFIIDSVTLALKDQLLWLDDLGLDEEKMATSLKSDETPAKEEAPAEKAPAEETTSEEETPAEEKTSEEETPANDGESED